MMCALIGVCIFAVAYNFVRFWEFKLGEPGSGQDVKMQLRSNHVYYLWYYTTLYLFTHFVVPFSLLIALNSLVAREIYLARKARQRLTRKQRGKNAIDRRVTSVATLASNTHWRCFQGSTLNLS